MMIFAKDIKTMMSKKISAVFLILCVMAISIAFVACDNAETGPAPTSGMEEDAGNGENPNGGEVEKFPLNAADYGGYEFRFLDFIAYGGGNWKALQYNELWAETQDGDPINDAIYDRNLKIEKLCNIKIKQVLHGDYADQLPDAAAKTIRLLLSGEDEYDAALYPGATMPSLLGRVNMTYDLLKIPELELSQPWWNQNCIAAYSIGGKLSVATGAISLGNTMGTEVLYFNKQLINDYNLENPYELVRSDKWTYDKLAEMAKTATRDLDGDGAIDPTDQIGIATENNFGHYIVLCAGETFTYKNSGDLPVLNRDLQRISDIIDKTFAIMADPAYSYSTHELSGGSLSKFLPAGHHAWYDFTMPKFRRNELLFYSQQLMCSLDLREMDADFGVLPFPKVDSLQKKYGSVGVEWFVKYIFIPVTNDNPAQTAAILNAFAYYGQDVIHAFYDRTVTYKALRDDDSLEMLKLMDQNRVYDLGYLYDWGEILSMYNSIFTSKTNSLFSLYEKRGDKIEAAMQKTIDELKNQ
jgi:hypothetical protein